MTQLLDNFVTTSCTKGAEGPTVGCTSVYKGVVKIREKFDRPL